MGILNNELEDKLLQLPDEVAQAKADWEMATLLREKTEAKLYLMFRVQYPEATATELKARINNSEDRSMAVENEVQREQIYNAKYETLMALKRQASLRTAY